MHLVDASGAVSTSLEGVHPGAEWSPDGTRLAYVSQSSGAGRIVVADADGSDAQEVRQDDMPQGWHWPLVWVSSNEVAVHHQAPGASSYTLWIVPVDGGPRRLVVDPADPQLSARDAAARLLARVLRHHVRRRRARASRRPHRREEDTSVHGGLGLVHGRRPAGRAGRTGSSSCGRTGQAKQ